jgi:Coenzyme PQQ synthesis protein D (PqqD)
MRLAVNNPHVISETIQGETIVIHLTTGTYYSLQEAGTAVWEAIVATASEAEIAEALERRYDAPRAEIEAAVGALIAELEQEDLVTQTAEPGLRPVGLAVGEPTADRLPFTPPKLAKYTDMQDLVLLDPVHEVSEAGWPQTRAEALGA